MSSTVIIDMEKNLSPKQRLQVIEAMASNLIGLIDDELLSLARQTDEAPVVAVVIARALVKANNGNGALEGGLEKDEMTFLRQLAESWCPEWA